jgi:acyl-CoA synthetase (AMP-forming)/AMP-acid ligase II
LADALSRARGPEPRGLDGFCPVEQRSAALSLGDADRFAERGRGDVFDWCAQHLAEHTRPSLVDFVDSLPRTPVGKVDRHALSQAYASSAE